MDNKTREIAEFLVDKIAVSLSNNDHFQGGTLMKAAGRKHLTELFKSALTAVHKKGWDEAIAVVEYNQQLNNPPLFAPEKIRETAGSQILKDAFPGLS